MHRPRDEQEADAFAASLLMPERLLRPAFVERFDSEIDGRVPDEDLAFNLRPAMRNRVDARELAARGARYRALLVAQTRTWLGVPIVSLAEAFRVSPSAMAIELEEAGLVR